MHLSSTIHENYEDEIITDTDSDCIQITKFAFERYFYESTVFNFIGYIGLKSTEVLFYQFDEKEINYRDLIHRKREINILYEVNQKIVSDVLFFYFVEFYVNIYFRCNGIPSRIKIRSIKYYYFFTMSCYQSREISHLYGKNHIYNSNTAKSFNSVSKKTKLKKKWEKVLLIQKNSYIPNSEKKPIVKWKVIEKKKIINYSVQNERHETSDSILTIKLKTLMQCSNFKNLHKFLYHKENHLRNANNSPIYQESINDYCHNPLTVKEIFLRSTITTAHKKGAIDQKEKILNSKFSGVQESLGCTFLVVFTFFILHNEEIIVSVLERKEKLKVYCCNHSRIIISLNDYLLHEEDNKYCKITIESNTNLDLLHTLDVINIVFPEWSLWKKGNLDTNLIF